MGAALPLYAPMATLPQRWLRVVNMVVIVLSAWLVAGTVDAMVATHYAGTAPEASSGHATTTMPGGATTSVKSLDAFLGPIKSRNVFNHGEPVPDEATVPGGGGPGGATVGPADACTIPITVLSAVVAPNNPDLSLATLMDNTQSPAQLVVLQVGERIGNEATIAAVREEADDLDTIPVVELQTDDGRRQVCKAEGANKPTNVAMAMPGTGAAPPAAGSGIKKVTDNSYEVEKRVIDGVMNGGLAELSTQVRIVPYFEGGQSKGFKMYSIQPGTLLANIGLMNGDVIQKINGYDISSPEKALQVYGLLKNESSISVDLSRNGQSKSLSYSIR